MLTDENDRLTLAKRYVVIVDKSYYPEIYYFDTRENAKKYAEELEKDHREDHPDDEAVICVCEISHISLLAVSE